MSTGVLSASFFARPTLLVAPEMLGQILVRVTERGVLAGRIVEVEAYLGPNDPASHAYRRTGRSEVMWGPPGRAYVYFTYGNHFCLNAVTEPEGVAGAILIRALEPLSGIAIMRENRGDAAREERDLCSGPGKLTQALSIDGSFNGCDLLGSRPLYVVRGYLRQGERIRRSPRVGISRATDWPWRFLLEPNSHVSAARKASMPRPRTRGQPARGPAALKDESSSADRKTGV